MTNPSSLRCKWYPSVDPWRKIGVAKTYDHALRAGATRRQELLYFLNNLAELAYEYQYSFDVLVSMSHLETDTWRAPHWTDRLNPGSIGIGDLRDLGYGWESGEDAAKAMIAHFSVYVDGWNEALARDGILGKNPRYFAVWEAAGYPGSCKTLANFGNGRWASDPHYAQKVAGRYDLLRGL